MRSPLSSQRQPPLRLYHPAQSLPSEPTAQEVHTGWKPPQAGEEQNLQLISSPLCHLPFARENS